MYNFPKYDENLLRDKRLAAYYWGVASAASPIVIRSFFIFPAPELTWLEVVKSFVPDISFFGVAIAILSMLNTNFSFVKLEGCVSCGKWNQIVSGFIILFAFLSLFVYLKVTYNIYSNRSDLMLIISSLLFTYCVFALGLALHYIFVAEEVRQASSYSSKGGVDG